MQSQLVFDDALRSGLANVLNLARQVQKIRQKDQRSSWPHEEDRERTRSTGAGAQHFLHRPGPIRKLQQRVIEIGIVPMRNGRLSEERPENAAANHEKMTQKAGRQGNWRQTPGGDDQEPRESEIASDVAQQAASGAEPVAQIGQRSKANHSGGNRVGG